MLGGRDYSLNSYTMQKARDDDDLPVREAKRLEHLSGWKGVVWAHPRWVDKKLNGLGVSEGDQERLGAAGLDWGVLFDSVLKMVEAGVSKEAAEVIFLSRGEAHNFEEWAIFLNGGREGV